MWPLTQARPKFSQRRCPGIDSGSLTISASLLNDDITAHISGSTTIAAHSSRKACEKTFSTPPRSLPPAAGRAAVRWSARCDLVLAASRVIAFMSGLLVLEPVATDRGQLHPGEHQREDRHGHSERAGV